MGTSWIISGYSYGYAPQTPPPPPPPLPLPVSSVGNPGERRGVRGDEEHAYPGPGCVDGKHHHPGPTPPMQPRWWNGHTYQETMANGASYGSWHPRGYKFGWVETIGRVALVLKWLFTFGLAFVIVRTLTATVGSRWSSQPVLDGGDQSWHCHGPAVDYGSTKLFRFSPESKFQFFEKTERQNPPHGAYISIDGQVTVEGVENADEITVEFDIKMSDEGLRDAISFESSEDIMKYEIDLRKYNPKYPIPHRLFTHATIKIPYYYSLSLLYLSIQDFRTHLAGSLTLTPKNFNITGTFGVIDSAATLLHPGVTNIDLGYGSIKGAFSLNSSLHLSATSGSIDVVLYPQQGPKEQAEYVAKTVSGSIRTALSTLDVPVRNYTTYVSSQHGSIGGAYPLGVSSVFSTQAGSIDVSLVSVDPSVHANLETTSTQGSVKVGFPNGLRRKRLHSKHTTVMGRVEACYPDDWEGAFTATTQTGKVSVDGRGLAVDEWKKIGWTGARVVGHKGDRKEGSVQLGCQVGSVALRVR